MNIEKNYMCNLRLKGADIYKGSGITNSQAAEKAIEVDAKLRNESPETDQITRNIDNGSYQKKDKQEILKAARAKSVGWSIFLAPFSNIYYALRNENTVASRFDLDPDKDQNFIKQVKKEQALWTLPTLIPGLGVLPGLVTWTYCKLADETKFNVEKN